MQSFEYYMHSIHMCNGNAATLSLWSYNYIWRTSCLDWILHHIHNTLTFILCLCVIYSLTGRPTSNWVIFVNNFPRFLSCYTCWLTDHMVWVHLGILLSDYYNLSVTLCEGNAGNPTGLKHWRSLTKDLGKCFLTAFTCIKSFIVSQGCIFY